MKNLRSVYCNNGCIDVSFEIEHRTLGRNGTVLRQNLDLTREKDLWKASIDFSNIDGWKSPDEAVQKLAEWMERMAEELKTHSFSTIFLEDLKRG